MKKFVFLILILTGSIFAQSTAESGMSFLKNGFGARNIALGDLGVVGINDVTAINYNPSLLSKFKHSEVAFMYNSFLPDATTNYFAAGTKIFGLPFVLGINSTRISDIEVRTTPGKPSAYFNISYFVASISTGFELTNKLDFGLTLKYLYEGYLKEDASGYAFDFGLTYNKLIENLDIGFSIKNLGSMNKLFNVESKLPVDYRLGVSYKYILQENILNLNLISGIQKFSTSDVHFSFGTEACYKNLIYGRIGYLSGYEIKDFSYGFGLKWKNMKLDYSFLNYEINSASHTISINYIF